MKIQMLAVLSLIVAAHPASAGGVQITKGQLTHTGSYATQVMAVANNTGQPIESLKIECGFFRDADLLAAGMGFAQNVRANQTAYVEVIATDAGRANKTDCRVGE